MKEVTAWKGDPPPLRMAFVKGLGWNILFISITIIQRIPMGWYFVF
jgi:hypothetical protein